MKRSIRERLDRATKNQKRRYPSMTWTIAREYARLWCSSMWPDFALHEHDRLAKRRAVRP